MTRIILIFTFFLFSCQDPASDSDTKALIENDFQFDLMAEYLELSETQLNEFRSKRNNLREKGYRHRDGSKMKEMFESLNEEQKEKMIALKKGMKSGNVPEEFVALKKQRITEYLDLTDDQKDKFFALSEASKEELKAMKSTMKRSKENAGKMKELKQNHREKLASILSEEQLEKLEAINGDRGKRKHHRKAMFKERRNDIAESLNLSEDQKKKIKAMKESARSQMKELKGLNLTDDELKTRFKALKDQHRNELKTILTEEQFQKLQELEKNRSKRRAHRSRF